MYIIYLYIIYIEREIYENLYRHKHYSVFLLITCKWLGVYPPGVGATPV